MSTWNQIIEHPSAWKRADLQNDQSWIVVLEREEIQELEEGLANAKLAGTRLQDISRENYPLPRLEGKLRGILEELENGRGLAILRGVPVDGHTVEELSAMYMAIGCYLGERLTQTADGVILSHVADMGHAYGQRDIRGYYTKAKLLFHTDNADMVGLLCVRKAKRGGLSSVTSTITLFNEILQNHPEHLEQCFIGFHHDLKGENAPGVPPVTPHKVPVFSYCDGYLSSCFNTSYTELGAKKLGIEFTRIERETIDLVNRLAAREDLRFDFLMEPGDIQFVNDHTTIHSRTEFEDYEEPDLKRLLLRLWLRVPNGRPMTLEIANRGYGPGSARNGVPAFREPSGMDALSLRIT